MGKRKYESDKGDPAKKVKQDVREELEDGIQPQSDGDAKEISIPGGFDVKHFRKELSGKQGQTMVLTQFLQVCLNPDNKVDYLLEYLKAGGNSHEILRQVTSDSKKNLTLTTPAFHLFHLIILKVQSSLPHMIAITEEACRYFLNTFMPTVEIMISESSGPRHRKIVLKLLTSMVTLNSDLGIEVLNQAPLTPKHLQHIVEKPNYKEKDNVRTSFVHFMTSFLVEGHLPLIKALLEKGLLGLVVPGLIHDEGEAVLMFLNILKKNVIDNNLLSKSLKLKTFSHHVLHNMFKLFSWKGPPDTSNEAKNELRLEIWNLLSDIMLILFTNHKIGLYFIDSSLGTTDTNKNPNLYKALLSLKRPWENEKECEVVLDIAYRCPDLHRAIISVIEQSFEPQHSPIWARTTEFTHKLMTKLKPEDMISKMTNMSPQQIANFVRFITLPVPLLKFVNHSLDKDLTISLYCVRVLGKMLSTLQRYLHILDMSDDSAPAADLKTRLEHFLPKHLPPPSTIVKLIDIVISGKEDTDTTQDYKLPIINNTEALISLIDLLLLYNVVHPALFESLEGTIDMKMVLDHSVTLSEGPVALLKFKVVSLWLTLDNSAISLKNPMFKELFLIMLDVYMSEDETTWVEAKDTLYSFFKNTSIFEGDEDEIHVILYTLRNSQVNAPSLIGDIVEYVLEHFKYLSETVRCQLVNFEISDENSATALEKLFNDLTENKISEDTLFLENKVPSPFIIGCMQYLQSNKSARKILKPFLSLYIVNLLHNNYSPELTEVLIGDSKVEARTYVGSWTNQPISLPDPISEKDAILKNISKSIIDNEEVTIEDIFPFIKKSEQDEDIVLNGVSYNFNLDKNIDSSELLIWAKYLIFCTVRLTDMTQMTDERLKKITDYFYCLIAVSRKLHKIDICRTIITSLLKNPHVLKIYRPLNLNKDPQNLLATDFILKIITDHKDIVDYLNTKQKILKSYQQKNYSEIVKAFVKINKRKNIESNHTIKVLEIVGLAKEDDEKVFNQIFSTEVANCVNDDKEPSLVLEVLKNLVDKYSNAANLELQPQILRKCMKLYTELLTDKEVNPNLTSIEDSLSKYIENKPHQANKISEELFKKFFETNIVRKSTSYFAHTLLKHNIKLCNAFKEIVTKPEILSLRELTLPLGNAVINHKHFPLENKPLLATVYSEYKSNINKLLEKPQKAGPVYITNSDFIKKLVLECMDLKECEKLFSKTHKFESVEVTHIHLVYITFLKLCTSDKLRKEHFLNYFMTMLHLAALALKEGKEIHVLKEIITDMYRVVQIGRTIDKICNIEKEEYKKITEGAIWQSFCKAVLKDSLKVKTAHQGVLIGPQLLCLVTNLVKLFYPADHEDINNLFDMVTSHSEFLNVMLSHHSSEIKSRLLEFLYTLIRMNKSVMKTAQIPVYLSSYHATRSPCDRLILAILYHYESSGLPVNEYKPYVWGDSGANHYAVRKNRTSSLWAHPTPNQVMNLFEKDIIEKTIMNFPVTQKLDYHYDLPSNIDDLTIDCIKNVIDNMTRDGITRHSVVKDVEGSVRNVALKGKYNEVLEEFKVRDLVSTSHGDPDQGVYDPVFVFPLLSHLLAPGSAASCFKLLRIGLLGLPVMALSSECPRMRAAAYHVLHRFCLLLEMETRHKNDKLFLNDFISTLRQSLNSALSNVDQADDLKNPRLPAVDALYLARALMVSTAPFDPLYKPVNNFLIAKQFVDLSVVPDFLSLFHDSEVEATERRHWILDVIKDGVKTMTDINVIFKTMCIKMILDFYSSVLSDRKTKEKILGVVSALVSVPRACEILIEGYGLVSWLHSVCRQMSREEKSVLKALLNVITDVIYSLKLNSLSKIIGLRLKNSQSIDFIDLKLNKDLEDEILTILYDCLRNVEGSEPTEMTEYLAIYNSLPRRTVKSLNKNKMINLVNMAGDCYKCQNVAILSKALVASDLSMLNSKLISSVPALTELTTLVKSYIV